MIVQCQGYVGGAAIGVAATAGHRTATPHTTFRLAAPAMQFSGTPEEIAEHGARLDYGLIDVIRA